MTVQEVHGQHSCLYVGSVRHRRFQPRGHEFNFGLYMIFLDLSEIGNLIPESVWWSTRRFALNRFRRSDYHGDPGLPLYDAVSATIKEQTGHIVTGPIRILTHLRTLGYCFNPVTFYFCYDQTDSQVEAVLAEVTNTPWKERYPYVLTPDQNMGTQGLHRYRMPKSFHVSPFMGMDQLYDWRFSLPGSTLTVHFTNYQSVGAYLDDRPDSGDPPRPYFDATLSVERRPLNLRNLLAINLRYPLMAHQVITMIHWHALRLFLKRVPFHRHPSKRDGKHN